MVHHAQSGHPGGALGLADIFSVLYGDVLHHKPKQPDWDGRDYLFLSNGHTCPVLYATLAEHGYFPKKELMSFRQLGSRLQGHPHIGSLPGIENSGGPLGQGISQAVGLAASLQREGKKNRVFCVVGDGELEEGQCWEAMLFAAKERVENLVVIVDRNYIQIDGSTKDVSHLDPLSKKVAAFNWKTITFDGNDIIQIRHAFKEALLVDRPVCLIAKTIPGKGVSFMEKDFHWHGKALDDSQLKQALEELEDIKT
jgi:transketolase